MLALVLRHGVDTPRAQIERDPALSLEETPIGLEPSRAATAGQEAIGDDDVGVPAGCGQRALLNQVPATCDQKRPGKALARDDQRTEFGAAPAARPLRDSQRLPIGPGELEQVLLRISTFAIA